MAYSTVYSHSFQNFELFGIAISPATVDTKLMLSSRLGPSASPSVRNHADAYAVSKAADCHRISPSWSGGGEHDADNPRDLGEE